MLLDDKEIGLEANAGKTKNTSGHQNVSRSNNMKMHNRNFARVDVIKYWQINTTILNCIQEGVNSWVKSGNICCLSLQNILSLILLSNNINSKITSNKTLPVVLYGCETWSLTLREERRLKVFENRVLRGIFGPKREKR